MYKYGFIIYRLKIICLQYIAIYDNMDKANKVLLFSG